jgi:hypothetical protein
MAAASQAAGVWTRPPEKSDMLITPETAVLMGMEAGTTEGVRVRDIGDLVCSR